ncbi:MAG TPA: methylaspartate mutase accessory protein GlmL [Gammaproteobacteria bacterium]|nr:methylaspartate mutase accessory protein GlmL [Gammaproteobacteria bacterium]
MNALLIDFGSTYTKLRAVTLDPIRVLASGQGPSTITHDVTEGMDAALDDLESRIGALPKFDLRLACSSAAGGLRMVTVGLVRELTAEAARQAALGAGARLVGSFAQRLTSKDVAGIESLAPDILLLAGGTDGGNSEVIRHNARALAAARLNCPVNVAGNRAAADDVSEELAAGAKTVTVTENVMPEFGQLNIAPARGAVRRIFIERIVHAKGIDRAATHFDQVLMPTPAAVLEAARLLSEGAGGEPGLGPLMVVDVGGATTDVHSVAGGEPGQAGVVQRGLPEPYMKRTVEGDLGMRHNARGILAETGAETIAATAGLEASRVKAIIDSIAADTNRLPEDKQERTLDFALGHAAVRVAVRRHAGTVETVYTVNGPVLVQRGKDLSAIDTVIGTGGVLAHGDDSAGILQAALAEESEPFSLRPKQPRLLLDRDYMLFAVGLLASVAPEAAVRLGKAHLENAGEDREHGRNTVAGR